MQGLLTVEGVPWWLLFFLEGHRPPPVTSFNLNCLLKSLTLGLGLRGAALGQFGLCCMCAAHASSSRFLHLERRPCGAGLCHSAVSSAHCRDRPPYPCDPPTALCGDPPQAPALRASRGFFLEVRLLSFGSARMVSHPRPASVMLLQATSLNPVTPTAHEPQQHTVMSFWSENRNS